MMHTVDKPLQPFGNSNTPHYWNYHCDHAIVLFPGTTAAKEGDEENHHTNSNEDNGNY